MSLDIVKDFTNGEGIGLTYFKAYTKMNWKLIQILREKLNEVCYTES